MSKTYQLKVDAFCHIIPKKFKDIAFGGDSNSYQRAQLELQPALYDLESNLRWSEQAVLLNGN